MGCVCDFVCEGGGGGGYVWDCHPNFTAILRDLAELQEYTGELLP